MRKNLLRPLLITAVLSVAFYGVSIFAGDADAVLEAVSRVGLTGMIGILGLTSASLGVRFLRWQSYLGQLRHHVPVGRSLCFYLGGFAFTITPGKVGEATRSIYLKQYGVPYASSLAMLFVERFVDVVGMVLLVLLVGLEFEGTVTMTIVLAAALLALIPMIHSERLHALLNRLANGIRNQKLQSLLLRSLRLMPAASLLLRNKPLYGGLAAALLAWCLEGYAFYLILGFLGLDIQLLVAIGIYATGSLAGALSLIPGGLGSAEVVMGSLLLLAGADTPTAISATLIFRVMTLWMAVGLGVIMTLVAEKITNEPEKKEFEAFQKDLNQSQSRSS